MAATRNIFLPEQPLNASCNSNPPPPSCPFGSPKRLLTRRKTQKLKRKCKNPKIDFVFDQHNYTNLETIKSPRWDFEMISGPWWTGWGGGHEVRTRVNLAVAAAHLHAPMDQLRLSLPPSLVVVDSDSIGNRLQVHSFQICPFSTQNGPQPFSVFSWKLFHSFLIWFIFFLWFETRKRGATFQEKIIPPADCGWWTECALIFFSAVGKSLGKKKRNENWITRWPEWALPDKMLTESVRKISSLLRPESAPVNPLGYSKGNCARWMEHNRKEKKTRPKSVIKLTEDFRSPPPPPTLRCLAVAFLA